MSSESYVIDKESKVSHRHILIGCTGSVASIKLPQLVNKLLALENCLIKVVPTEHARHFFKEEDVPDVAFVLDSDEWNTWNDRGDPVLHIELAKWADVFLIAPLDANTLGKISSGICDNLLTCIARAWDMSKPLIFCPAMNTKMYEHPITGKQIEMLKSWGHIEVPVISKVLVCGDKGLGAMAEVDTIVAVVTEHVTRT